MSVVLEPILGPADIPDPVRIAFFAGNVAGVSLTAYLLLQYFVRQRDREHERSEQLLLNVLPGPIAVRLKRGETAIADRFPEATVLFADIVNFTPMSSSQPPERVVEVLSDIFSAFDLFAYARGLEKMMPDLAPGRAGVGSQAVDERRIVVTKDGPYRVEGGVPLLRTAIVQTERGEPIAWDEGPTFETPGEVYELCRCGNSSSKPFCDSTSCRNERIPFDGTETADRGPIADRREAWEGEEGHVLYDDLSLCTHAGFCRNVRTGVWEMVEEADDPDVRAEFTAMTTRCPSGRLAYAVLPDREPVEPSFEPSVGVEPNASYWIRGGIPVVSEDETPYEVRNRQTLCRCGQSRNKPFCDGSHKAYGFDDPAVPD